MSAEGPKLPKQNAEAGPRQGREEVGAYILLAKELSQSAESFPFPELTPESYAKLKAATDEFPEYSTPIDALVERFRQHGMKIVLGKYPESGNVFVLPGDSDDIEMDSIFPRHLGTTPDMDPRIARLVLTSQKLGSG